ncbi:radical SAM family uncharacterized protein [Orenia metallireducens]|uniref:Radical SAM family uncharacterized protein n=1 Tax=Orenia metallireducens TaxID=1413210 RepID=A0A285HBC6_9FIRM|nr:TIGR03960 family B12-binding radical SAM protein [Orenia metallireducens]PRX28978.1 radical SAM family uncharacterized protein [Orenia metallireducens]SNY32954.1 radical SAM family uncharacterized protein [Orenia metallireducens]
MTIDLANKIEEILPEVSKPTRYMGNELNMIKKDLNQVKVKFALAFPDVYEVAMSHLGIKILYHLLNEREDTVAERVYAPWVDMEQKMREHNLPLFTLENRAKVVDFDILGFTLQYEMSYTNILNMLDLAGIPLKSKDRGEEFPLVIVGGPCAFNPEPLAPFVDVVLLGEAEAAIGELVDQYLVWKDSGASKKDLLKSLSQIEGLYIPSFYEIDYNDDGEVVKFEAKNDAPEILKKRVIQNLDESYYPEKLILPYMEIVHDRVTLEVARGCTRGCRFCQAGMIYRPVRERSHERIKDLAKKLIESTGYEEISLSSLSTSDYSKIEDLAKKLLEEYKDQRVSVALPSMRVDSFSVDLAKELQAVRKTGLTFAPEAGTQRLRDVINKGINEEDLLKTTEAAFKEGWRRVKLYFMMGLPTETLEDIKGIADLAKKVAEMGDEIRRNSDNKRRVKVGVSVSTFVPKPHTPFQWSKFNTLEEIKEKQQLLRNELRGKDLSFTWTDPYLSTMEAVFARGDRRAAEVMQRAWELGAKFDGWSEHFDYQRWKQAFEESGYNLEEYVYRNFNLEGRLPWDHLEVGVDKGYLRKEYQKAIDVELTPDCRFNNCTGCGILKNLDARISLIGGENSGK